MAVKIVSCKQMHESSILFLYNCECINCNSFHLTKFDMIHVFLFFSVRYNMTNFRSKVLPFQDALRKQLFKSCLFHALSISLKGQIKKIMNRGEHLLVFRMIRKKMFVSILKIGDQQISNGISTLSVSSLILFPVKPTVRFMSNI